MSGDADLLRRAARWVRDASGRAQGVSWDWRRDREFPFSKWRIVDEQDESVAALMGAHPGADAEWVSVFGPQLAEPLAEWLEAEADLIPAIKTVNDAAPKLMDALAEQEGVEEPPKWEVSVHLSTTPSAVAMARALLGEGVDSGGD